MRQQRGCVIFLAAISAVLAAAAAVVIAGLYSLGRAFDGVGDDVCERSSEPLQQHARTGDIDRLRADLDGGADPNAIDGSGNTTLGCAIPREQTEVARLLLERGADPNLPSGKDEYRELPLGLAARQSGDVTALVVLDRGADPNRTLPGRGFPLTTALDGRHPALVAALLAHGADANGGPDPVRSATSATTTSSIPYLQTNPCSAPPKLPLQATPDAATVTELLDHGADPNGRDGRRPLVDAIGRLDVASVDVLVPRGADPSLPVSAEGGRSIRDDGLATAVARRSPPMVSRLLDLGADPHVTVSAPCPSLGSSPSLAVTECPRPLVVVAADSRDDESLALLLRHGADPDQTGEDGATTLSAAAARCDGDAVQLLVHAGASPTASPVGARPVDVACPELRPGFGP